MFLKVTDPGVALLIGTPPRPIHVTFYTTVADLLEQETALSIDVTEIGINRARQMIPYCSVTHPALTPMSKPYHLAANYLFRNGGMFYALFSSITDPDERLIGTAHGKYYPSADFANRCIVLQGDTEEFEVMA